MRVPIAAILVGRAVVVLLRARAGHPRGEE
jgi:hypothetical protein